MVSGSLKPAHARSRARMTMEIVGSPSILTLPSQQLSAIDIQRIIDVAIDKATHTLVSEINELRKENAELKAKLSRMEHDINTADENAVIAIENVAKLRRSLSHGNSDLSENRRLALKSMLIANGGKMSFKDAMRLIGISKYQFSRLIRTCDFVEVKNSKTDKRKKYLILTDR